MKIKTLAVAPTAFLHLKGPDGQYLYDDDKGEKKVGIDLYSPGSRQAALVDARRSQRVIQRMQDNDNKFSIPPIEQQRTEAAEDLKDLTAGFHNLEYDGPDGKPLTGSALFAAVYSDPEMGWINAQVNKFTGDWGKFKAA
jgi:hypothetical protein